MSSEVESAIVAMVRPLREQRSGIRWVRAANLHLTLRFLGDAVYRNVLVALDKTLNEVASQTSPFILHVRGIGVFPNFDRPRIIWIGLVSEQLIRLARQVEDAAVEAGLTPEARPYTPHLTVGRVRALQGWQRIRQVLDQFSILDFGSTLISEMTLYRSILGGEASQYQTLAHYPFVASPLLE